MGNICMYISVLKCSFHGVLIIAFFERALARLLG